MLSWSLSGLKGKSPSLSTRIDLLWMLFRISVFSWRYSSDHLGGGSPENPLGGLIRPSESGTFLKTAVTGKVTTGTLALRKRTTVLETQICCSAVKESTRLPNVCGQQTQRLSS